MGRNDWLTPEPFGPAGWLFDHCCEGGRIIVTASEEDSEWWVHASIAWQARLPTYDELKLLHFAVYRNGWAYLPFAPPDEHVNFHENALHLFGRLDGRPLMPDFTHGANMI